MRFLATTMILLGSYACAVASLFAGSVAGLFFAVGWVLLMWFCRRVLFPKDRP